MDWVVIGAGALLTAAAWRLVARGVTAIWIPMAVVMGVAGLAALLAEPIAWSPRVSTATAAAAGLGAGFALWAATRAFVAVAGRWAPFRRHVAELYDQRKGISLSAALGLALLVVAPGEEAFWRGLVQSKAAAETSRLAGAPIAWVGYVVANAFSGSLPITAGAVVGGAVWGALAFWTGGILAPLACHVVWTGLMLVLPPKEATA